MNKIQPPFLKPGDEVAIVSPAFTIEEHKLEKAVRVIESWGLKVRVGKNALKTDGPFAGTDRERINDFQKATNDKNIRAVFCSRGGYGMSRIINRIDFKALKKYPKWYVGFSDITVLHMWLSEKCNMVSVHGEMPLNYSDPGKSVETMDSLYKALFGGWEPVRWKGEFIRSGDISGEVSGGNLSLLWSLTGTPAEPGTRGRILFIEDTGEHLYRLDRMLTSLKLAGKLKGLAALVAGGFNDIQETSRPWGRSPAEIIKDIVAGYSYPVLFNFPAGHINDNRSFYIGRRASVQIRGDEATLDYV